MGFFARAAAAAAAAVKAVKPAALGIFKGPAATSGKYLAATATTVKPPLYVTASAATAAPAAPADPASTMFNFLKNKPALQSSMAAETADYENIKGLAETAAENNANKAKLNRALTNYLNDSRNLIPFESDDTRSAAVGVPEDFTPDGVVKATIDEINNNLALDNALIEKPSNEVNAANLKIENDTLMKESMKAFTAAQRNITAFKQECVKKAVEQFQEALIRLCHGPDPVKQISTEMSGAIMKQLAESWSEFLISPTQLDSSVYLSYKTFFFRVNQAIDALLTQCVFLSTKWATTFPPPPPGSPPPPLPFRLIKSTGNIEMSYPRVKVGPFYYAIGPILDFQNIEGRIFIYVKCYSDASYTNGIYFWVYRSQSEGFYRVFFKLDPFGSIEKGFDYTQGTFVHLRLQMALCDYYQTHYRQGIRNPIKIDTLTRLNYFMSNMPDLQVDRFLDTFPGTIIEPSFYSKVSSTEVRVEKCAKGENKDECCYVCLTESYVKPTPSPTQTLTQSPGMIGHYYIIDDIFASIIKRGFPLQPPSLNSSGWSDILKMSCKKKGGPATPENQRSIVTKLYQEWQNQCELYFPNDHTHKHYDFSRRILMYETTCPYIFCFTTCGLTQSCPMFKLFLSANSYKNTFWCQGFQNYTEKLSFDPSRELLSPVLCVVIGGLLQDPDMKLSTLRNILLNIGIMADDKTISQIYNKATKALMTLGTRNFGDPDTSTRMPHATPPRLVATLALNPQGLQFIPGSHRNIKNDASLDAIIKEKVANKINMIVCLAQIYNEHTPTSTHPFFVEVNRLLDFHPGYKDNFITRINLAAENTKEPKHAAKKIEANEFIAASPEAAAAALFGYISSPKKLENEPTEFEKDLTDLAHVCLKQAWMSGMMNDAYHALQGVFNSEDAIYNYLGKDGAFHDFDEFNTDEISHPYVFISSFDEVRKVDTSPTSPDKNPDGTTTELNVTVVTFAHIYRVDCGYHEVFANGDSLLKSMSIIYQISITVVYTRENPSRILYAVTHRTPLLCLPDLPDALRKFSKTTDMGGGTIPGTEEPGTKPRPKLELKKPDYGQENPLSPRVPALKAGVRFGNHRKDVKASRENQQQRQAAIIAEQQRQAAIIAQQAIAEAPQKKSIAVEEQNLLIKNTEHPLTTPYTLCATYKRVTSYGAFFAGKMMEYFFGGSNGYYQLPYFFRNFDKFLKVCHQYDSTVLMYKYDVPPYNLLLPFPNGKELLYASIQPYFTGLGITLDTDSIDIQAKLAKNTKDIQAIFKYLTGDFMVDPGILDDVSAVGDDSQVSTSTTSTTSSIKSTSSDAIRYFLLGPLEKEDNQSGNESSQDPSWSQSSQYLGDSQSSLSSLDAGTLPIKNHIKKSITTRKNKNQNKSRTKTNSRTPVRRITIRIKRMMKSKVTKPRTYKRKATGGNRKSKPNKTMRRYRRVRK